MLRAGVDLGGTKIQAVITDENSKVWGTFRCFTPQEGGPADVCDAMADAVKQAMADGALSYDDLVGLGIGAPGQIDLEAGTVSNAGNLPNWMITYPLSREMTARLRVPTYLGNDVQVAVNAEVSLGAGRPYNSMIGVFCGTGVGGGVVINRELW
ncbi:MAG: ROK family protein, partial [Actinomycetes bacterium]